MSVSIKINFNDKNEGNKFVEAYSNNDNYHGSIDTRTNNDDSLSVQISRDDVENFTTLYQDITVSGGKVDLND